MFIGSKKKSLQKGDVVDHPVHVMFGQQDK